MSAVVLFIAKIKDPNKFKAYGKQAGPTIPAFGGEIIARGGIAKVLDGETDRNFVGILRFPDVAAAETWRKSADYKKVVPLRDEAADVDILVVDAAD